MESHNQLEEADHRQNVFAFLNLSYRGRGDDFGRSSRARSPEASAPNSIPVFKDTPHFVIPYQFLRTGAVSSISS